MFVVTWEHPNQPNRHATTPDEPTANEIADALAHKGRKHVVYYELQGDQP